VRSTFAPQRARELIAELLDRDWVLAISLAFFVAVFVWFVRSVKDFVAPSAADVLVPAFAGQTLEDANAECERLGVTCSVLERDASDRFPRDVIMAQQPGPGTRVREGRAISFVVSTGVQIFPMPDLRFESLRNAQLALGRLKLNLAHTSVVANDDVPANYVLTQDPVPLTSVREGSAVRLTLSKGPPASVVLPTLVNLSIDEARDRAARARVHLGQIVWTPFGPNGPPRGTVVRQAPLGGKLIDPFAPVSLQVSAGPTEYGYLVRQVHATVAVPPSTGVARVRMEVRDQTGSWNAYDGYAQGGQKLDLSVTAIGTAEVDTYVNEELLNATKVGVEPPGLPAVPAGGAPKPPVRK
jgi:eukaryotic-like serine/threonine-protein kinase